jgi:hypothetical protein
MGRSMKLATCHSMPSNHYVDKIENTIDILWLFGLNIFIHFSVLPCSSPCSSYVSHWFSLTEFETIRNRPQPQQRDAAPSHVRCASDSPGLAAVQFDQRGARPRAWRCRAGEMYCRLMQINMKDYERYAIDTQDQDRSRYAGSSCKPVSGLKQQHCQWHFLGCWNLLNNVECTANVALAGSWVVPRCRCPLDQLRLHSFALPSPDLFQTCDFDCHSLVDLQIDLRLRLIGLAKWRPRATTCSKESKSKITSACAMIRFDFGCLRIRGFNSPRCNYPRARLCSLASLGSFGQRM